MDEIERARAKLRAAGVFFYDDPSELDEDDDPEMLQMLNMNDTWGWACADGEYVPDDELPELARLFFDYGWCGVLYWVSERREQCRSEFCDVNRFVEFVRKEEAIRKEIPNDSQRAYAQREYTVNAQLPQCWRLNESGELTQDVPILPGMKVWTPYWDGPKPGKVAGLSVQLEPDSIWAGGGADADKLANSPEAAEKLLLTQRPASG